MTIHKRFVVYETNNVMGRPDHKALEEVDFGLVSNNFETEEEAINAILNFQKLYTDFLILRQIYITDH